MIPLVIEKANRRLFPPGDLQRDYHSFFAREHQGVYFTHWEPTAAELALLNAGGVVQLQTAGSVHPVVHLKAVEGSHIRQDRKDQGRFPPPISPTLPPATPIPPPASDDREPA